MGFFAPFRFFLQQSLTVKETFHPQSIAMIRSELLSNFFIHYKHRDTELRSMNKQKKPTAIQSSVGLRAEAKDPPLEVEITCFDRGDSSPPAGGSELLSIFFCYKKQLHSRAWVGLSERAACPPIGGRDPPTEVH
jgi:hypothetical protein